MTEIIVETTSWEATTGRVKVGGHVFDCTLGRAGVIAADDKREGDGKTPLGTYPLRQLIWRADRAPRPETQLPVEELTPETGWCEDPADPAYNTKVALPHTGSVDRMTRDDHLYDYVIVVGYNDAPPVAGRGSAIFIHLAREAMTPTKGCVGLRRADMLTLLKACDSNATLTVLPPPDSPS